MDSFKKLLEKQHYGITGKCSAIQICRWTKKSLLDEGVCYKEKFYGIKSHRCCQMSPFFSCQNKCLHCWRPIESSPVKIEEFDKPRDLIENSIKMQRKLLTGFKGNKKINMEKYKEAQEPSQFAISLIGEPTLYPYLGELIENLRKRKISSFLVTNGLEPEKLLKLGKKKQLPTQLYLSLNSSNKKDYEKWHNSLDKNAWKKFNKTIKIFPKLKTRKVIRMTLVLGENMNSKQEYAKLILKANPDFIEVKGFMSVGFSRKRFGYEKMPMHENIVDFSKKLLTFLPKYKILDEQEFSRVVLLGKTRNSMEIKSSEI